MTPLANANDPDHLVPPCLKVLSATPNSLIIQLTLPILRPIRARPGRTNQHRRTYTLGPILLTNLLLADPTSATLTPTPTPTITATRTAGTYRTKAPHVPNSRTMEQQTKLPPLTLTLPTLLAIATSKARAKGNDLDRPMPQSATLTSHQHTQHTHFKG